MVRIRNLIGIALLGTTCAGLALVACSSSGAKSTASSSASGSNRAAFDRIRADPKAQACLKAAGIPVPRARTFPSRSRPRAASHPGSRLSFPADRAPSGFPSGRGSDSAQQQKIRAALRARGIALPGGANRPSGSPSVVPSSTPSS